MSGFINKALVSTAVGMIFGEDFSNPDTLNPAALVITYMSLWAKDFYDFCKGDIVTVTRKDENGQSVEKKFQHYGFDAVKCSASLVGLLGISLASNKCSDGGGVAICLGAAVAELLHDTLNLGNKVEFYQEINGNNNFMVI